MPWTVNVALLTEESRAEKIPNSHNHPRFSAGVSGTELLARLREQAGRYQIDIRTAEIESLHKVANIFIGKAAGEEIRAKRILLASHRTSSRSASATTRCETIVGYHRGSFGYPYRGGPTHGCRHLKSQYNGYQRRDAPDSSIWELEESATLAAGANWGMEFAGATMHFRFHFKEDGIKFIMACKYRVFIPGAARRLLRQAYQSDLCNHRK
jgi:hypothetical protein